MKNPTTVSMSVDPSLEAELSKLSLKVQRAGTIAVREALNYAELYGRSLTLVGSKGGSNAGLWSNDTGNLSKTLTGYVAGDPASDVYRYEGLVEVPSSGITRTIRSVNKKTGQVRERELSLKESYLASHYRVDRSVSPPVVRKKGEITGVLHKYMQYAPAVQMMFDNHVTVLALADPGTWARLLHHWTIEMDR